MKQLLIKQKNDLLFKAQILSNSGKKIESQFMYFKIARLHEELAKYSERNAAWDLCLAIHCYLSSYSIPEARKVLNRLREMDKQSSFPVADFEEAIKEFQKTESLFREQFYDRYIGTNKENFELDNLLLQERFVEDINDPESVVPLEMRAYALARSNGRAGEVQNSISYYGILKEIRNNSADSVILYSDALNKAEMTESALLELEKIKQEDFRVFAYRAYYMRKLKRNPEEIIHVSSRAIDLSLSQIETKKSHQNAVDLAHLTLALTYEQRGDFNEAIRIYLKAKENDRNIVMWNTSIALLLMKTDKKKALEFTREEILPIVRLGDLFRNKSAAWTYILVGDTFFVQEDYKQAIEYYEFAIFILNKFKTPETVVRTDKIFQRIKALENSFHKKDGKLKFNLLSFLSNEIRQIKMKVPLSDVLDVRTMILNDALSNASIGL